MRGIISDDNSEFMNYNSLEWLYYIYVCVSVLVSSI